MITSDDIRIPSDQVRKFLWAGVDSGIKWLEALPTMVDSICQQYSIELSPTLPELGMNLVLFGDSVTEGPVVLKLAQPHVDITNEISMLHLMDGHGYTKLIAAEESSAWCLQQRVIPGTTLQSLTQSSEISDENATRIAAYLMAKAPASLPQTHTFPDLRRWLNSLFDYAVNHPFGGALPQDQVDLALRHANSMLDIPKKRRLIHGDFHHGNIIQGDAGWTIIDPKGIIAEQSFEIGPWFYNPIGIDKRADLVQLFRRRLDIFEQTLDIDRVHLWRSALVACVLCDCWTAGGLITKPYHFNTITAALMQLPERYA